MHQKFRKVIQKFKLTLAKEIQNCINIFQWDEFLKVSKPLKLNKLSGFEEIRVNVIKQIYNDIKKVLVRISGESIKLGDFTLKIE